MELFCPECKTLTKTTRDIPDVEQAACPSCRTLSRFKDGEWVKIRTFEDRRMTNGFAVGQKGVIKGTEYEITGIVVKKVYGNFFWREYTLVDAQGNFRFLSESEGNFIFLKEIDATTTRSQKDYATYEGAEFKIFDKVSCVIFSAQGFFDFKMPDGKIPMREYIDPPYILSFETFNGEELGYHGEHISRRAVKKAFNGAELPYKGSIGMVQPFPFRLSSMAAVFCVTAILMFTTHFFVYSGQARQQVLNTALPFDGKDFVSPSFELKGGSAPMTIDVSSNVDNTWASVTVALVNEETNDEIYASKDVEYYHGYTDGENWTEGSTAEDFNICGVPAGKYHLVVTPTRQPEDTMNQEMLVTATWSDPSTRNIWVVLIGLAIVTGGFFLYYRYLETQRWADSPYTPYSSE